MTGITFLRESCIPEFEIKHCDVIGLSYRNHFHDELSIGMVEEGSTRVWCDGQTLSTEAGQFITIPPRMPHSCNPDERSPWSYWMIFIQDAWVKNALEAYGRDMSLVDRPFLLNRAESAQTRIMLKHLIRLVSFASSPLETEAAVLHLVMTLTKSGGLWDGYQPAHTEESKRLEWIKEYLQAHPLEKVTLEELERAAGISRFHLVRAFKNAYRLPPHTYQNQLRINMAKKELLKRRSIIEVALETGYYDQSHFTRAFKDCVGVTPQQYMKSV